jgi:Fur family iron response transcriptional regulator
MEQVFEKQNLSKNAVIDLLKAHSITPTQQRIDIAAILFARPQHMSAEEVLSAANLSQAHVSKATVYNTLGLFAAKGLVREVIVDPAKVFYDSNTQPHHHFFNVDTGVLTDIDPALVAIERLPEAPGGTAAEGVDVVIRVRNKS